jgi:PhnB protein
MFVLVEEVSMRVKPIPDGYPIVSPYICVAGATDAIAFYTAVFGATERMRIGAPDGKVGHAELAIGDSVVMVSDEFPDWGAHGPGAYGGTAVTLGVYVEDVDATFARAVERGAQVVRHVEDQFYGDRSGQFTDPWGHRWSVATHIEDVTPEEVERRGAAAMSNAA